LGLQLSDNEDDIIEQTDRTERAPNSEIIMTDNEGIK